MKTGNPDRRRWFALASTLAALWCTQAAQAQDRYVDPVAGVDTAPCDIALSPCQTLAFAIANALPADEIHLVSVAGAPVVINESGLAIAFDLTISGQGAASTTIDAGGADRIFSISGGTVVIRDVTLTNGDPGFANGGAIELVGGDLRLTRAVLSNNEASFGGAVAAGPGSGTVTLLGTTLQDNLATGSGGGIWCDSCNGITTTLSRIIDNVTGGLGGGIYVWGADATIWTSRLMRNNADSGGAIYANFASLNILDTEVSKNEADSTDGGAIFTGGNLVIQRSSVSENTAATSGGAVYFYGSGNDFLSSNSTYSGNEALCGGAVTFFPNFGPGGDILVGTSTFYDNTSTFPGCAEHFVGGFNSFGLYNSIVANDPAAVGLDPLCSGAMTAGNHNLADDASCDAAAGGFSLGVVTGLAATLAYNGGLTRTHNLDPASNAVDTGNNVACLNPATGAALVMDQRAQPRPFDFNGNGVAECDIGALELQ